MAVPLRGVINAAVVLPDRLPAEVRLRLRSVDGRPMKSVEINGKPWPHFDAKGEFVVIPAGTKGGVRMAVRY